MIFSAIVTVCLSVEGKQPHCRFYASPTVSFQSQQQCQASTQESAATYRAEQLKALPLSAVFVKGTCMTRAQYDTRVALIPAFADSLGATYSLRFY